MAKMRCTCGTILRDDDPDKSYFILSRKEFDVELDSEALFGRAVLALRCGTCGRLWIAWDELAEPVEYLEVQDDRTD